MKFFCIWAVSLPLFVLAMNFLFFAFTGQTFLPGASFDMQFARMLVGLVSGFGAGFILIFWDFK